MLITFPLWSLLIPFGVVVALFIFTAFFNVYNLVRFDATNGTSFIATFAFLAGASLVLFLTHRELKGVDWQTPIVIGAPQSAYSGPEPL